MSIHLRQTSSYLIDDYVSEIPLTVIGSNRSREQVHGANMGPTWGRQDPGGPHVGPMNLASRGKLNKNAPLTLLLARKRHCAWGGPSISPLPWRHNGLDGVSNHQPHLCLLSRLFGRTSKKTSKLRVTGLCTGNSPGTGEFPAKMASNAENVFIWWRHHDSVRFKNTINYCSQQLHTIRCYCVALDT